MTKEDNVVRPVFGKKKETIPAEKPTTSKPPEREVSDDYKHIELTGAALFRAQKDAIYMLTNMDYVRSMGKKLEEAGDTIFSLKGFTPDQESIRLRREGLKSYSLEDICKAAEETHELQWRSQPSFLGALSLEHHSRVQAALSTMKDESE